MTTRDVLGTGYLGTVNRYLDTSARPSRPSRPRRSAPAERHAVVVGADTTAAASIAVDHAAIEAALRGWELHIVHAQPRAATAHGRSVARDHGAALLERMCDRVHSGTDTVPVTSRLVVGSPVSCLLGETAPGDLLVVGAGHTRAAGLLAGATSNDVAARHRGTVLVVRMPGIPLSASWAARPLVTGFDGSPWSERAVRFALEEATLRACELTVLWSLPVWMSRADAQLRRSRLEAEAARNGVITHLLEIDSGARDRFVRESAHAAAMVVGSRGIGGLGGLLLGSVSQALIHRAHCPVFIVH
ncbi:universal stress protein [Catenuloplanes indicus]|uniref:Nucleotide-binding universal stress UspA family protein n=1 Tax=Catenuloplanes indicus TaxID=137267 RepID=A0AAE3VTT9_9ACTN|nr:universal stress protein [Catenuloplanes indicus]MDQ0363552.1 nucleotide-binding universal stress UspA family protein [Catenuloplanes indicus]